jgi:hypothetical protein
VLLDEYARVDGERPGASWQALREESGDAEGQQGDDRRERDDEDEHSTGKDGRGRGCVARLGDSPEVLKLVFAGADRRRTRRSRRGSWVCELPCILVAPSVFACVSRS